jgi:hypothetical protein
MDGDNRLTLSVDRLTPQSDPNIRITRAFQYSEDVKQDTTHTVKELDYVGVWKTWMERL